MPSIIKQQNLFKSSRFDKHMCFQLNFYNLKYYKKYNQLMLNCKLSMQDRNLSIIMLYLYYSICLYKYNMEINSIKFEIQLHHKQHKQINLYKLSKNTDNFGNPQNFHHHRNDLSIDIQEPLLDLIHMLNNLCQKFDKYYNNIYKESKANDFHRQKIHPNNYKPLHSLQLYLIKDHK